MNTLAQKTIEKWKHAGFQRYFRNTSWMFLGQASMFISLFINIWLARYLGPDKFGAISYVFAFVGIFAFVANLGVNDILIRNLVKEPEKKDAHLGTAFRLLTIAGISAFLLVAISALIFEKDILIKSLIIVYATIFLWSPINVISAYFQATVQAKKNAQAQIISTVLVSLVKILIIFLSKGIIWLIGAFVLDYIVGSILYIINYARTGYKMHTWKFDPQIAKELLKASYLLTLSAAMGYILLKIDQVMVKFYLGQTSVGLYAVAVKLSEIWYFIPGIICSSIFPAIINAKTTNHEVYASRLKKLYIFLTGSALAIAIPVALLAPYIIKILYGADYITSVPILQIYVWSGIGLFLTTGINRYFLAENHLHKIFYFNLLAVVLNIGLNFILIPKIGLNGAAWATLISYSISPVIVLITHRNIFKAHE